MEIGGIRGLVHGSIVDVVGVVVACEPSVTVKKKTDEMVSRRTMILQDRTGRIKLSLWKQLTDGIGAEAYEVGNNGNW